MERAQARNLRAENQKVAEFVGQPGTWKFNISRQQAARLLPEAQAFLAPLLHLTHRYRTGLYPLHSTQSLRMLNNTNHHPA
jgi:hypothetical protein